VLSSTYRATVDASQLSAAADALGIDGEVRRTWGRLLLAHRRLTRRMDADLRAAGGSLVTYDVLRQVAIAHPDGVRMSDLAERLLLGQAGLSGRIDRLERAGRSSVRRTRTTRGACWCG
jgi:hypothetical protein